jgi:hypothetical protein
VDAFVGGIGGDDAIVRDHGIVVADEEHRAKYGDKKQSDEKKRSFHHSCPRARQVKIKITSFKRGF